jgi:hypothetical protein
LSFHAELAAPTSEEWKLIGNAVQQHNVASLYLETNEIRKMPESIGNLNSLKVLSVYGTV